VPAPVLIQRDGGVKTGDEHAREDLPDVQHASNGPAATGIPAITSRQPARNLGRARSSWLARRNTPGAITESDGRHRVRSSLPTGCGSRG
jgi:hypothetical protein